MQILLDEGFQFGLGAFETIAVVEGRPVFLREHLERLKGTTDFLGISRQVEEGEVLEYLAAHPGFCGGLKIAVSGKNKIFLMRDNIYTEEVYARGFRAEISPVRRNETSPLTYHKTMNYGDCILEKRRASQAGVDERIFLNTRGEISEGTVSNVFFVKGGKLFTPELSCGLLPGILRGYVLSRYGAEETRIRPEELEEYEECFLTNSLMGIMPVVRIGEHIFGGRRTADRLLAEYRKRFLVS